jgi:hypothetical protein
MSSRNYADVRHHIRMNERFRYPSINYAPADNSCFRWVWFVELDFRDVREYTSMNHRLLGF